MEKYLEKFVLKVKSICDFNNASLPEEYYYPSLVLCVLDAVFSINARYNPTTKNVINRYIEYYKLEELDTEHTLSDFLDNINSVSDINTFAKEILRNCQRTSSRNGILKAEACYALATILREYGINTLSDFRSLSADQQKVMDKEILNIPGQKSGIMLKYLYMLAGSESICKPDRHIRKFIEQTIDKQLNNDEIQQLLDLTCNEMKKEFPNITVRLIDNKIWDYQKRI